MGWLQGGGWGWHKEFCNSVSLFLWSEVCRDYLSLLRRRLAVARCTLSENKSEDEWTRSNINCIVSDYQDSLFSQLFFLHCAAAAVSLFSASDSRKISFLCAQYCFFMYISLLFFIELNYQDSTSQCRQRAKSESELSWNGGGWEKSNSVSWIWNQHWNFLCHVCLHSRLSTNSQLVSVGLAADLPPYHTRRREIFSTKFSFSIRRARREEDFSSF